MAAPLYPFLPAQRRLSVCDDCCGAVTNLTGNFGFFGRQYNKYLVTNNGLIQFNVSLPCTFQYSPVAFPSTNASVLAAYWGDADTRILFVPESGVYHSNFLGPSPIDGILGITSQEWIIATWYKVGYYSARTNRINTFQAVVATDRQDTYACYIYPNATESGNINGGLDWTTGEATNGTNGLGGIPAQVGFDAGDRVNFYQLPESRTDRIRSIDGVPGGAPPAFSTTNTGLTGRFCYKISDTTIVADPAPNIVSPQQNQALVSSLSNVEFIANFANGQFTVTAQGNTLATATAVNNVLRTTIDLSAFPEGPLQINLVNSTGFTTDTVTVIIDISNFLTITSPSSGQDVNSNFLVAGTTDPSSSLAFTVVGGNAVELELSTTADATGNWVLDMASALALFPDGPVTVTATSTDPNGNVASNSVTFNLDTTTPQSLFINPIGTVNDDAGGNIQVDGIGAEAGTQVTVIVTDPNGLSITRPGVYLGEGNWETDVFSIGSLSFGQIVVEAFQTDAAGNRGDSTFTSFIFTNGDCDFDAICDASENDVSCTDCFTGFFCGNTLCELNESPDLCPDDCLLIACGNDVCDAQEHLGFCSDCFIDSLCGNGQCDFNESPDTCPAECFTGSCGNGICEDNEHLGFCREDCFVNANCGNRICDLNEANNSCPADCNGNTCGDGICEIDEHTGTCSDCRPPQPTCGNRICEYSENTVTCSRDCSNQSCGDGICSLQEQSGTCGDCSHTVACGNAVCDDNETPVICSIDCSNHNCGNGVCEADEHPGTCPSDCIALITCGNGACEANEHPSSCPSDCSSSSCGDTVCSLSENTVICPNDCFETRSDCANGVCEHNENVLSCPADCNTSSCGNGICEESEQIGICPSDCFITNCGDEVCEFNESPVNCPGDCSYATPCGNGVCEDTEHVGFCPEDCSVLCGNAVCDVEEDPSTCRRDCSSSSCGNGVCDLTEHSDTCPEDCFSDGVCGNQLCETREHQGICPEDCTSTACGDGVCSSAETFVNCPADCSDVACGDGVCDAEEQEGFCDDCSSTTCGNRICEQQESVGSCPSDCTASTCGDNLCQETESPFSCARDCTALGCGNTICESMENQVICPEDCLSEFCGNGRCERSENPVTCPDCVAQSCGNGVCDIHEHSGTCSDDCAATCGDAVCDENETTNNCQLDCSTSSCGDGICGRQENQFICRNDCNSTTCGDGICDARENVASCSRDCNVRSCGNDICEADENNNTCSEDCSNVLCGNSICHETNESLGSCPSDCSLITCGNGICEFNENIRVCAADCTNNVCTPDGMCDTFEFSTCIDCTSPCNTNGVCESNELTVGCQDCQSSLQSFQVSVYHDENLNGLMDSTEQLWQSAKVYLDTNEDQTYTLSVDPVFEGYPASIQLRKQSYFVGVVPSSLGGFVIGRTAQPGITRFLASPSSHVMIPVNINFRPVLESVTDTVTAEYGEPVSIQVITDQTDRNNNIDPDSAIRITEFPLEGTVEIVNGQVIYTPFSDAIRSGYQITIRLIVCDLVGACSGETTITINYSPLDGYEDLSDRNSASSLLPYFFVLSFVLAFFL